MRFNNIQLLRLFAAVGVVLFHLGIHAPILIGVDPEFLRFPVLAGFPVPLFFAVSGFVLTHAVRNAPPGRFLFARFLRLYPGYWLAIIGVLVFWRLRVFTEHHRWLVYFVSVDAVTLWPVGPNRVMPLAGVEWSLIYEVFLSVAVAGLSLFGRRRAVPVLTAAWLAVLLVKMAVWPGYAFDQYPHWSTIAVSVVNVPFLLGVLVYQVKDRGRHWRWVVGPVVVGLLYAIWRVPMSPEVQWWCLGLAAAGAVWLAVTLRQIKESNPLARLGDCTYGLFLFHVPLMFAVLYPASRLGWSGRVEVVWLAGAVAIIGGLLFGRLEAALHMKLRPLAKLKLVDVAGRIRARLPFRTTARL